MDLVLGAGLALLFVAAGGLVALDIATHPRAAAARKLLDKVQWTGRARALARTIVMVGVLVQIAGPWIAALTALAVMLSHTAATYLRVRLDQMFAARPQRPGRNLKSGATYDRVWGSLNAARRRKVAILYGADVALTVPIAGLSLLSQGDMIGTTAARAGQLLIVATSVLAVGFVIWRVRRRSEGFHRDDVPTRIEKKLRKELVAYKPEVVVYFSGSSEDRYQLDQWMGPINALKRRVLIVVREETHLAGLPKTKFPVVAARTVRQLDSTIVPSLKLALYVSNAAKNMHLLRNGTLSHAYLNHGDSDKVSSANPFSRAYDTLFVAGQAGLDRYLRVGFDGVKPAIEMVGRPQLQGLAKATGSAAASSTSGSTILYAPTWEGLVNSADYSSITSLGVGLAQAAAEQQRAKLLIRPHPNTGRTSEAHRATLVTLEKIAADSDWVEIDTEKELLSSLARADVMISDVSAVVSDYLATGRPIVMTRPSDRSDADFTEEFPLAGATALVSSDDPAHALFLAHEAMDTDPMQETRSNFTEHVLGYHPKGPQRTFAESIDGLLAPQHDSGAPAVAESPRSILITLNALDVGGAERDVVELSAALADRGHEVTVLARDGEIRASLDDRVRFIERPSNLAGDARRLFKAAANADVINTHDLRSLALLATLRQRPPIHATVHNVESGRNDRVARRLLRKVANSASFVSEAERSRLFPNESFGDVIRHGLVAALPERLGSAGRPRKDLVVFVGRLSHEKGADQLIRAMVHLPDRRLRIVGDGPERATLERLASEVHVSDRVTFAGSSDRPFDDLSQAGVVAVPSRKESLPRVVREAAALGRPVVASPLDGIIEAIDNYKRVTYADAADDRAFAKALAGAADTVDRRPRRASGKPSWDQSGWRPLISAIEDLGGDAHDESSTDGSEQRHPADDLAAEKAVEHERSERQDRHLDSVDQVAGDQRWPSQLAPGSNGWEQERESAQHGSAQSDHDRSSEPTDIAGPADPIEPHDGEHAHDAWFDEEVRKLVESPAEVGLLSSPSSDLSVGAVTEQIQLSENDGGTAGQNRRRSEHDGRTQPGDDHHGGHRVVVDGESADSPGHPSRDSTSVETPSPVLPAFLSRKDVGAVVGERGHEDSDSSITAFPERQSRTGRGENE